MNKRRGNGETAEAGRVLRSRVLPNLDRASAASKRRSSGESLTRPTRSRSSAGSKSETGASSSGNGAPTSSGRDGSARSARLGTGVEDIGNGAYSNSSSRVNSGSLQSPTTYETYETKSSGGSGNCGSSSSSSSSSDPEIATIRRFRSCLEEDNVENDCFVDSSPKGMRPILLRRALSIRELDDDSWLSSSLIDLVISKFSKSYPQTHFMSIDFVVLHLSSKNKSELELATDISGKRLNYLDPHMPIVFVCNSKDIHWNLVRVIRHPKPELQLFEPMGKPENRHGGLGYRDIPRCVVDWLNTCIPLKNKMSWLTVGVSAITIRQQLNHFDCGTAVLLYAEKCGQGYRAEEINKYTNQENITEYRKLLQDFVKGIDALE